MDEEWEREERNHRRHYEALVDALCVVSLGWASADDRIVFDRASEFVSNHARRQRLLSLFSLAKERLREFDDGSSRGQGKAPTEAQAE